MNKTEFIAAVAAKEGLEKKTAEKAVNADASFTLRDIATS